jgi:hypothetical protein
MQMIIIFSKYYEIKKKTFKKINNNLKGSNYTIF